MWSSAQSEQHFSACSGYLWKFVDIKLTFLLVTQGNSICSPLYHKHGTFKGELLCFSVFPDLLMLLQCQIPMLNDAKALHNEVRAYGSEPCRLFQLALQAVFQKVFTSLFAQWLQRMLDFPTGACLVMPAPCTQRCACPLPNSDQTPLRFALCLMDYIVRTLFKMAPIKSFSKVNEGQ